MAGTKNENLDPDKIKVNTKRIGRRVLVYNHTSSTNDIAAEYAKNKKNDGLAIFAEEQTAGRGRTGAKWLSGRCDSVLCSILLTSCKCNPELLSLACPVAVAEAVGKIAHSHAKIKWPNDIILNGKKVAGIMVESKKVNGSTAYIIGIGINCHQKKTSFPSELQTAATSIDIESSSICDRISLAKRLLSSLDHWLETAEDASEKIIDRWRKLNTLLNQRIMVSYNSRKYTGNCIGVDPEKGLILQLDRGGVRFFHAAHTAIAK
ncbi:MAG: biotin--[acetyl-CoA-carboxylase] ligase [Phycisphaerae bacterium]|jgi:BirA family biotin operon repressor/biotin-[acetyl-CoA-carboxylase] ligase